MSGYQTLRFRIIGVSSLLMHNGQLADPLNPHSKSIAQVASKRRKTEADHLRMAELEFLGSLYLSGGVPCIPAEMIEAALVKAAGQDRRGTKVKAGLVVRDNLRLEYEGPKKPQALWEDEAFRLRSPARVGAVKVMRTRPKFSAWEAECAVDFLPTLLNPSDVQGFLTIAGEQIGIGDWRPRFGRFSVAAPSPPARRRRP